MNDVSLRGLVARSLLRIECPLEEVAQLRGAFGMQEDGYGVKTLGGELVRSGRFMCSDVPIVASGVSDSGFAIAIGLIDGIFDRNAACCDGAVVDSVGIRHLKVKRSRPRSILVVCVC